MFYYIMCHVVCYVVFHMVCHVVCYSVCHVVYVTWFIPEECTVLCVVNLSFQSFSSSVSH